MPNVQSTPDFKVGEIIECRHTREQFTVLAITPEGSLQCAGRAGLMPRSSAQRPLTPDQKAQLAAELQADSERSES